MFDVQTMTTDDKATGYASVLEQARALTAGEADRVANAANISALLFYALPDVIWTGFYFFDGSELVEEIELRYVPQRCVCATYDSL